MIAGIFGQFTFGAVDGSPQDVQLTFEEATEPWENSRAFSEMGAKADIFDLITEVDLVLPGDRQILKIQYGQFVGNVVNLSIRVGPVMENYPNHKVLHVRDITENKIVALRAGGLQGGLYQLVYQWTFSKVGAVI